MDELRIDLAAFQGPVDLLLHLVQQEEVDIQDIPVARIADRFLAVCREQVGALDIDRAGEFLVMASHLLVLKSRSLLPRDEPVDLEDIDPRLDLVRQLLEYRDFKSVSAELAERWETQRQKVPVRVRPPSRRQDLAEEELEVDLFGLVSAFQRLLTETGEEETVALAKERLPITHFVGRIFDQLVAVGGRISFRELIGAGKDRSYIIGAFLALLELIKLRKIRAVQNGLGEIEIEMNEGAIEPGGEGDEDDAAHAIDAPDLHEEARKGPRVVFMGSPDFAVPSLQALVGAGYAPVLVVTPPPERAGRGRRLKQVAVAQAADELQLPLHRTRDVNGKASFAEVAAAEPDVIITAGFGQKLKKALLALPKHGCLNVHASLLPQHRGASPVAAAIRAGDAEVGVSIFLMTKGLDEGPVLSLRGFALGEDETCTEATARLSVIGADLLASTLDGYLAGEIEAQAQDEAQASYVGRLDKADGIVKWDQSAENVRNHIRAMTEWPGAQSMWKPSVRHDPMPVVFVASAVVAEEDLPDVPAEVRPGTVLRVTKEGIDVACESGVLRILRLRPQGKRVMAVRDFLNARRVVAGDRFVAPKA